MSLLSTSTCNGRACMGGRLHHGSIASALLRNKLFVRHDLVSRIMNINKRLELISNNRIKYLGNTITASSTEHQSYNDMAIKQFRTEVEADPIGQDVYVEDIKPRLLGGDGQRICIVSIVGMGGLGKTTLAKRLYNDKEVASHFNLQAWLTISQKYLVIDLLTSLMMQLKLIKEDNTVKMQEDEMKIKLKDHLREKNFIIVLDDIWETSCLKYLQAIFPEQHNGITVLLTTRKQNIATDVDPHSQVIELQHLQDEYSWQLFCKHAFTDAKCPEDFLQFKDKVIQRCKGLPLSIIVLGGLLRRRNDSKYWIKVLGQISVNSSQEGEELEHGILALSYDHLPRHLKACFLYVAGYPEDCEINAKQLMWMWIAEGLIQQQERCTMEDVAEEYLEELMQRSLVQIVSRSEVGKILTIRVHDLVLDMACKEAQEINFLHRNIPPKVQYMPDVSLCDDGVIHRHFTCHHNCPLPKLHSLCIQYATRSGIEIPSTYNFMFHLAKFLRVLSLQGIQFPNRKCPEAVGNMIQLRYLSLDDWYLEELPNNISNLRNLQTLDVQVTSVKQVPEKFWEIASLRHVRGNWLRINAPCKEEDVDNKLKKKLQRLQACACVETNPPSKRDESQLSNLQTLKGIPNYRWILTDGLLKLTSIRDLRLGGVYITKASRCHTFASRIGSWKIFKRKLEAKVIDAIESLKHLVVLHLNRELASIKVLTARNTSLQRLELFNRPGRENGVEEVKNEVGENTCLGYHLKYLGLCGMKLREDEMEVIGSLPNLHSLSIVNDRSLEKLVFKEGSFSSLKQLELERCYELESWEANGGDYWSTKMLQRVEIEWCPKLRVLPQGLQIKEIQLAGHETTEEVKTWAKHMSESPTNTIIIETDYLTRLLE